MSLFASNPDDDFFSVTSRDTSDADDHASCLQRWQQRYDQLTAGLFAGNFEEFWFDDVQIFRERTNQAVHEAGQAWEGSRTFGIPVEVDGNGWYCGQIFDINSIITLRGGDELDFRTPRLHEVLAVTTDAQALNAYALQVEHRDLEAELTGRRVLHPAPEQVKALRELLGTMMASLRATPDLLRHAAIRKALAQAIYSGVIASTTNDAAPARATPPGHTRQLLVDRAREYMNAHIEEPITVADLCAALGVSRRTLQYSFQDVLNLNPVSFLRALRLNGVRRDLKKAETQAGSIADIAARWGFWHLSHFAADYKAMFGELPSDTLRNARG